LVHTSPLLGLFFLLILRSRLCLASTRLQPQPQSVATFGPRQRFIATRDRGKQPPRIRPSLPAESAGRSLNSGIIDRLFALGAFGGRPPLWDAHHLDAFLLGTTNQRSSREEAAIRSIQFWGRRRKGSACLAYQRDNPAVVDGDSVPNPSYCVDSKPRAASRAREGLVGRTRSRLQPYRAWMRSVFGAQKSE